MISLAARNFPALSPGASWKNTAKSCRPGTSTDSAPAALGQALVSQASGETTITLQRKHWIGGSETQDVARNGGRLASHAGPPSLSAQPLASRSWLRLESRGADTVVLVKTGAARWAAILRNPHDSADFYTYRRLGDPVGHDHTFANTVRSLRQRPTTILMTAIHRGRSEHGSASSCGRARERTHGSSARPLAKRRSGRAPSPFPVARRVPCR